MQEVVSSISHQLPKAQVTAGLVDSVLPITTSQAAFVVTRSADSSDPFGNGDTAPDPSPGARRQSAAAV